MTRAQRGWLWSGTLLCAASGLSFAWMKYLLPGTDPFSAYHHPLQPYVLDAHVLLGPLLLFVIGWAFGAHALAQLGPRRERARRSGLSLLGSALPMVLSGYLLQVVTSEAVKPVIAWAHGLSGLAFALFLAGHALVARRRARTARGFTLWGARASAAPARRNGWPESR